MSGTHLPGRAFDWLARILGWSPVGRTLVFEHTEGPLAGLLSGRSGHVIEEDGSTLRIVADIGEAGTSLKDATFLLTPRHDGWTGRSLILSRVAFVVREDGPAGRGEQTSIAVVTLLQD